MHRNCRHPTSRCGCLDRFEAAWWSRHCRDRPRRPRTVRLKRYRDSAPNATSAAGYECDSCHGFSGIARTSPSGRSIADSLRPSLDAHQGLREACAPRSRPERSMGSARQHLRQTSGTAPNHRSNLRRPRHWRDGDRLSLKKRMAGAFPSQRKNESFER